MVPIEEIFCEVDDSCKRFFPAFERGLLPKEGSKRLRPSRMNASKIMMIPAVLPSFGQMAPKI